MEDSNLVAKTLLECYRYIDDLFYTLEEGARKSAEDSFCAIYPNEAMRIYEHIIDNTYRMQGLCNMKYLVEKAVSQSDKAAMLVIRGRFMENLTMAQVAVKYDLAMRTAYRYLIKGINAFQLELQKLGFDKNRILKEFKDEPLFMRMLNKVVREEDDAATASEIVDCTVKMNVKSSLSHRHNHRRHNSRHHDCGGNNPSCLTCRKSDACGA